MLIAFQSVPSTHDLELKHQESIHQLQIISKDEESRRLRVRRHVEGSDMQDLRQQLTARDFQLRELQSKLQHTESTTKLAKEALTKAQNALTTQTRELTCLKVGNDSAQILAEKLRLTRELSTLKPELEHLRAQMTHHTNVVAEKLSLERQLNTAEVELEAEKRARREVAKRGDQGKQVEEELRRLLKDAEKRVAIEKKERERQQSAEAQARTEMLEQRLEALRAKLRAAQADRNSNKPNAIQDEHTHDSGRGAPLRKGTTQQPINRKRSAHEMSIVNSTGSSPDSMDMNNRKAAKKRAAEQSFAGEKSLFSVTPFLSRNKTLSLDALAEEDEEDPDTSHIPQHGLDRISEPSEDLSSAQVAEDTTVLKALAARKTNLGSRAATQKVAKPRGRPRKVLVEASPNIAISAPLPGKAKAANGTARESPAGATKKAASVLSTVGTVIAEDALPETLTLDVSDDQPRAKQTSNGLDAELKKKKRRLATDVSKTIFDEPEPEIPTKVKRMGKTQLSTGGAGQGALKAKKIGMARSGFGGTHFSPLKKDRRGVASMLPWTQRAAGLERANQISTRGFNPMCTRPGVVLTLCGVGSPRFSSSNSRWKSRQGNDLYAREARVQGLKSRAAFKLLEASLDAKYSVFKKGQVVVDLGYAPGSWSQVAVERTKPTGRVVGIDLIPAQPPKGVSTIQGNFLSPDVQSMVKQFLKASASRNGAQQEPDVQNRAAQEAGGADDTTNSVQSRDMDQGLSPNLIEASPSTTANHRLVDVVLSDMSAPWDQSTGFGVNTLSNPYDRLMNTSGIGLRDHAGSMDLCNAALQFASDTLQSGGHFICKFYQGSEDKAFEALLRRLFTKVHREKPESSRKASPSVPASPPRSRLDLG
ncbi:FtsJ-like methyltransferase-domain-containing protein [Plectosphaerella plurivora]|uniref:rRNA methyltransferase 2, mitochondrial n=1 Tax=Plectosphaerella plurivora TaxID=936078 RepID=A0A9P9A5H6_9PEZI|nr:FtsJ-like methyltransferase-domain-containing protein [Plectosphaerella plurivora]